MYVSEILRGMAVTYRAEVIKQILILYKNNQSKYIMLFLNDGSLEKAVQKSMQKPTWNAFHSTLL